MLVVGLAVVLVLALISFRSPATGLLFFVVWTFTRPPEVIPGFGGALPLTRIFAMALVVATLFSFKVFRPRRFVSNRLNWAVLGFLFVNYLSALPGLSVGQSVATTNEFLPTVVFYFLLVNLLDTPARLRQCLWFYVAGVAWVAVSGLYLYRGTFGNGLIRAQAESLTFGNPNNLAEQLVLVLPFVFALLVTERILTARLALLAFLGVDFALLIFTGSRGGMLELFAVILLSALQSKRGVALASGVLVLFLALWSIAPPAYKQRYATLPGVLEDPQSADASAYGRLVGWYVAWEIFQDRPLLGVGAGNFPRAFERVYSYKGVHGWYEPHNLPGQVLGELGLLGVITFGAYVYVLLRESSAALHQATDFPKSLALLPWVLRACRVVVFTLFVVGISDHDMYFVNWYLAGSFVVVTRQLLLGEEGKKSLGNLSMRFSGPACG